MANTTYIGIDLGTSGCRTVAIAENGDILAEAAVTMPPSQQEGKAAEQSPQHWWQAVEQIMPQLLARIDPATVVAIAVDGTSGSVLLADGDGLPLTPALMYNDNRAVAQAEVIRRLAPRNSAAHGTGSGLAKLLWLIEHHQLPAGGRVHTQADWISGRLCGRYGHCDANNALKLGYDPLVRDWPAWLKNLGIDESLLPLVVTPATPIAPIGRELAHRWGIGADTLICAGTTDSTAAFIASGAGEPGEAVTSLGSTLVLKVIAEKPLFAPEYGVYSQPLGDLWLVGGSSNSGGAVLRQFFTDAQMARLSTRLQPEHPTGLDYYPLPGPGERFPYNDPKRLPRLAPRPRDEVQFFQGLLEGIARIEMEGYRKIAELGAPYPSSVRSLGGGAANQAWTAIRARLLGVPLLPAKQTQACYGSALLALRGVKSVPTTSPPYRSG